MIPLQRVDGLADNIVISVFNLDLLRCQMHNVECFAAVDPTVLNHHPADPAAVSPVRCRQPAGPFGRHLCRRPAGGRLPAAQGRPGVGPAVGGPARVEGDRRIGEASLSAAVFRFRKKAGTSKEGGRRKQGGQETKAPRRLD